MNEFFFEVDLVRKPATETMDAGVTDDDLKIINTLNRNGPLRKLANDDIQTRSIIILGEEPTSKSSIHPEGILNNRKITSLSTVAKLLPGSPMMVGHRLDKTPWGRTYKAAVRVGQPGYKGSVVKEAYWFMNDPEGQAIARKIDGGIWAEGSISYWFKEARCSICHKPMASFSFSGMNGKIPRCAHKIGEKDLETQQICYWYPYSVQMVAETSYVFKGAYLKTKSFLSADKEELRAAYSENEIASGYELETQLLDCGLDLKLLTKENHNGNPGENNIDPGGANDSQIPPEIGDSNIQQNSDGNNNPDTSGTNQAGAIEPNRDNTEGSVDNHAAADTTPSPDHVAIDTANSGDTTPDPESNSQPAGTDNQKGPATGNPENSDSSPDSGPGNHHSDGGLLNGQTENQNGETQSPEAQIDTIDPPGSPDSSDTNTGDNAGDGPGNAGGNDITPHGQNSEPSNPDINNVAPGTANSPEPGANSPATAAHPISETQDTGGCGTGSRDAVAFFDMLAARLGTDEAFTEVQAVIVSGELDFDEKETALRELLTAEEEGLLGEVIAFLSTMRLSASAGGDGVSEEILICSTCGDDFPVDHDGTCPDCQARLTLYEQNKAVLFRPVGPLKPKKAGAVNNEFFKQEAFRDLPDGTYFAEPKYDGVWMELHKKGGDIKLFTDEGNEYSGKFPKLVAEASALKTANFIIAGELTRWRGRQRLTHTDVTAWLHSKQDSYDDKEFKFKPFDIMFYMGQDLTRDSLADRRVKMDAVVTWGKRIHPTAHRVVKHVKGDAKIINAMNDRKTREGAMVKNVDGKYVKADEKFLYKWKQQYEVDARVTKVANKEGGGWVYTCEVGRGQNVKTIGQTFATKLKAAVGDIIQVSVDHVRYDKEKDRYSWFAPKVISLRADKKLPDPLSTVKKMARVSTGPESRNIITLTEVIPRLKRADLDVEIFLVGGIVEEGLVTHDIDIVTRQPLDENQVAALTDALGSHLSQYLDITCDPDGPAGPSISILADMKIADGKWKYSKKFVLQEHGWGKKVHYDLRFGAPRTKRMWGWTCFSMPPTEAGTKKTRCQEKKYHDPKWMDVDTKTLKPGEPGNPTKNLNAWMTKEDTGTYEYIRRKPKFLELVLHGKKLKGRYVFREIEVPIKSVKTAERHQVDGDEVGAKTDKIWIMWKPKDQNASAPVKKLAYRMMEDCLVYWETDEIDTVLEQSDELPCIDE